MFSVQKCPNVQRTVCVREAFVDGLLMVKGGAMLGAKEAPMKGKQLGALQCILLPLF